MANHAKLVDQEIYRSPVDDFELNYQEYLNDDDDDKQEAPVAVSKAPKGKGSNHGLGCRMKGLFDGFGGTDLKTIMRHLRRRRPKSGQALTNFMLSGNMEKVVDQHVKDFVHHFGRINPENGRIMGALRGNDFFNFGGLHNNLGNTGKVYLDNLMKGKCGKKRKVHKFKPIVVEELDFGAPKPAVPATPKAPVAPVAPVIPAPAVTPQKPKVDEPTYADSVSDFGLDFETEREKCLRNKTLFEDPEFPATAASLYYRTPPRDRIIWKRPGEIIANPQLITQGESRFDVKQGALGDCWFLAALANITLYDALFYRIVPPNQSFTENYAGIFHFQFWHYGKWVDVVVDDRLPTVNNQLYYLHSADNTEFWSALVEKAYAKLHGGYENLDGGTTAEALEDFTGGLTEYFDLRKSEKAAVLAALVKGMEMGSLFGCSIDADANIKEAQLRNGLVCGHAYSITAIHSITYYGEDTTLLRLRNPWGNEKEWNGAWSDGSSEWSKIDEATKKQIDVQFARDGEFWMSFEDFFSNFTQMEVCNLTAEIFDEIAEMTGVNRATETVEEEHQWHEIMEDGEWSSKKGTAGGCNNNPSTYPKNPQFSTFFTAPQSSIEADGNVTVIVAVLQKYRRELRSKGKDVLPIGVSIYSLGAEGTARSPLTAQFFSQNRPIARTTVFVNTREVTVRFRVPPGQYVIVPCTFDAYDDAEFLLRVYANGTLKSSLL
ncbi:Calpain clp-4 [Caenorhabditis elegans]|uniref:Calpain clp-4 n=1 Tax=Caenorhabditis elegans TaxID=6239 RepID=CAN4_CAEEL|nr:Calpain catalytic domain-containing protein [Caenorhabditis elegans]CCD73776.1 Calpain catalytic domain-containing protein [Caenorhabditis elegans]|eukprot:NP_497460.2 CaLPain family [Caenorhabditis elegans]